MRRTLLQRKEKRMTMFTELYALATTATLSMVVSADDKHGTLTISVMPRPKKDVADPDRRSTQPVRLGRRDMAIEVKEIVRRYRYNGMTLPDVAGMSPKEIRDLYSAQYPELVSAEIDTGEIVDGVQEITFKRAVGTK